MEPHENPLGTELSELLKKVISPDGVPQRGYLQTPEGKRILELVVALDLPWKEICALLKLSHATVKQALFVHGIKKNRKEHVLWSLERIACVEKYYRESWSLHTREESRAVREKMLKEVNALPGGVASWNAVDGLSRRYEWGHWGKGAILPKSTSKATEQQLVKGVERRMMELVRQGVLVASGADALCDMVQREFEEAARSTTLSLSKKSLQKRLLKLVWTKEANNALQEVVRMRFRVEEKFCPLFPHIPLEMVKVRERWHKGVIKTKVTPERAQPGIGRVRARKELGDLTKFKMPQTDSKNPFVAKTTVKRGEDFSLMILNGANMGVPHGGDIVGNVVRRDLSDADENGDVAVIATNIVAFDLKKAGGPRKIGRALVMGDNVNPNVFADPIYRADVERIIRDKPLDEIVYQTAEELLRNVLSGWHKVCIKPNKQPEFTRQVFVVLGPNEEELAKSISYWEIRYWTLLKQLELEAEKSIIASALKQAVKNGDQKQMAALEKELGVVQERYNRTTITNVATQESQRFYEHARALVVREIEQAIPNAHVIGQGTTVLEIDGAKIEISIPSHERVTDTLLRDYALRYGPKNLRGGLAPTVVICSPWALQFRMTVREADYDGKRGSTKVFVAPIAVDDAYVRKVLADVIKQEHPLAKAAFSEQFQPGALRLRRTNGIIDADIINVAALEAHERYLRPRGSKNGNGKKTALPAYARGSKYIWVATGTDQHWGGRAKEFVTEKESGKRLGMIEAVFHMMRREGLSQGDMMPVHLFSANDDPTQGQNFKARTQPDPHEISPQEIERQMLVLVEQSKNTEDSNELRTLISKMKRLSAYQIEKRGADFLLHQMKQMMERHLKENVDIFSAILRHSQKAGLRLRGVGEFGNVEFGGFDTRNVGVLNFGGGNHFEHTVEGELIEGPFYADYLRLLLLALPEWKGADEFLTHAVVSPHYSGQAMGWGTMRIGDGYEYGLDLRDTPPRMGGWGDPLYGVVRNDPQRGNYSRIFNGRMTLKTYGDKHFFAAVATPYAFYHMCAAGTHTDRYGEHGFPPNNTGVSFVGLPVDGPDNGPILLRILPYDVIKDFVETNPRPFDWGAFLPNPA